MSPTTAIASAGDWVEVRSPGGGPTRRGQILEVLGGPHHERYRVRWSDEHESILYPADGTHFVHPERHPARSESAANPTTRSRGSTAR